MNAVFWGLVALTLSVCLTIICMPLARRIGAVARPREDRWNRREIPLLGGIAIVVATALPLLAAAPANRRLHILLLGAGLIAAVGLIDDLRRIKPPTKLLGQLLAATLVVGMGLRLSLTGSAELDMLLTIVWLVGISNAFNLLDNMDGLAAGIAAIAAGFRLLFFQLDGDHQDAAAAAILLGATLGFLIYNCNPARIFMGDMGSMFLGFFVAGLSLVGDFAYSRGTVSILLIPVLLLLVPIFDTAFVTATRILAGRPISVGGRDHTSHRLVALGLSEKRAVHLLYLLAVASGVIATLSYQYGFSRSAVLIILLILGVGLLALHLSRVPVHPDGERAEHTPLVRLVVDFSHKWQVVTVLLDFVLIVAAYHGAYVLRFEDDLAQVQPYFLQSLPIVIVFQLLSLTAYGSHGGMWRYTSLIDLVRLVKAVSVGTLLAVGGVVFAFRFDGHSRSVFVLDWLLLTSFVCGSRISFRLFGELIRPSAAGSRRILIYGAGDGGELALREMQQNPALGRTVVAFLDDDPTKRRRRIRGVPVVGGVEGVERVLQAEPIAEVMVASRKIPDERVRRLEEMCGTYGVPVVRASMQIEIPGGIPGSSGAGDAVGVAARPGSSPP